jgi:hypothetical protein
LAFSVPEAETGEPVIRRGAALYLYTHDLQIWLPTSVSLKQ